MTSSLTQLKNLVHQARALSTPEARRAFVNETCGDDSELRGMLMEMLGITLAAPTLTKPTNLPAYTNDFYVDQTAIDTGSVIAGKYKILDQLGQGGMGTVYRARRVNDMKLDVAIKIVKPGMDSRHILARFKIEQQALALMNHPHIAKVLDAGMTEGGHPFFVMELVKGLPITRYCDQNKLPIEERLALFRDVCAAVHHAHQKGIVHRDLKPSNILVGMGEDRAVVKVIDFGLAKALNQPLTDDSVHTSISMFVGTWQYTAPEQAQLNNLDIDTRADIYSLGVILYELLTGQTPIAKHCLEKASYEEIIKMVRDDVPLKPSQRIQSSDHLQKIADHRQIEPVKLPKKLRGDLDWIVMKALEKDRNRRYESAHDLGAEIDRFLRHEPVLAGPPTFRYRFHKMVRRNRGKLAIFGLFLLVLIGGGVTAAIGWASASRERNRANEQTEIARAYIHFLNEELLSAADPDAQITAEQPFISNISVKSALDRAAQRVGNRFADQPLVEAAIRNTIGRAYIGLGDYKTARVHLARAEDLRQRHLGPKHPERLQALHDLAWLLISDSQLDQGAPLLMEALTLRLQTLGSDDPATCRTRGVYAKWLSHQGKHDEAMKLLEETLSIQKRLLTIKHRDTLSTMRELAELLLRKQDAAGSEKLLRETLLLQRETLGNDHPEVFLTLNHLALLLDDQKRFDEAEKIMLELLHLSEPVLGKEHPNYLIYSSNLAGVYHSQSKFLESLALYDHILPFLLKHSGPQNYLTLATMANKAALHIELRDFAAAEGLLLECYRLCRVHVGENSEETMTVLENIIALYDKWNQLEKAKEYEAILKKIKEKNAKPQ